MEHIPKPQGFQGKSSSSSSLKKSNGAIPQLFTSHVQLQPRALILALGLTCVLSKVSLWVTICLFQHYNHHRFLHHFRVEHLLPSSHPFISGLPWTTNCNITVFLSFQNHLILTLMFHCCIFFPSTYIKLYLFYFCIKDFKYTQFREHNINMKNTHVPTWQELNTLPYSLQLRLQVCCSCPHGTTSPMSKPFSPSLPRDSHSFGVHAHTF